MKARYPNKQRMQLCSLLALECLVLRPAAVADSGRTITGAYRTTYLQDDGTRTSFSSPRSAQTLISALVSVEGSGYMEFPGTLERNGSFVIPDVPVGLYFLKVWDQTLPGFVYLRQRTHSVLDFNELIAARPDLDYVTSETSVRLSISNLDPWTRGGFYSGDGFETYSSQAGFKLRPFEYGGAVPPETGATSYFGSIDWSQGADPDPIGLPKAALGDVVYFHQYPITQVGISPFDAIYKHSTKYARLTDVSLSDGVPTSVDVALSDAPQTGIVQADVRFSEYESLASDVNPVAVRASFLFYIFGHPYEVEYPGSPRHGSPILFVLAKNLFASPTMPDVDYGLLTYGQFLDPLWQEKTAIIYQLAVSFTAPEATTPTIHGTAIASYLSAPPSTPIVPVLGPPKAVQINGADAFEVQNAVGLQPEFSYWPPSLGIATSFWVQVFKLRNSAGRTVFDSVLSARTYELSFKLPPGVLSSGNTYFAEIVAVGAVWDVIDAPFGQGVSSHQAGCVTNTFTP